MTNEPFPFCTDLQVKERKNNDLDASIAEAFMAPPPDDRAADNVAAPTGPFRWIGRMVLSSWDSPQVMKSMSSVSTKRHLPESMPLVT